MDINTRYSCAIVLGGFVSEDQNGEGYFNDSSDRFIQAIKLKTSGVTDKLLFTGGNADLNPSGFREAEWISSQLNEFNIPDSSVLIEKNSRNTLENARFSKALLEKNRLAPPYLLVTSAFHMRRSLLTFKTMGVEVVPYSSNYIAGRDKLSFDDFLPRLDILSTWNFYIKEVVGFWAYKLKLKA
ncbi:MAG: YdcF family protein [Sphingobacteriaceae bacterium]